jgi:adenylate cyclase
VASEKIDFDAEGLLKGLRGKAREGRRRLLEELAAEGVPLDELRRAVAEDRLALLPVERVLAGGGRRYTVEEVVERSGLERERLEAQWRALGLAIPDDDQPVFTEPDVEAAQRIAALREAGIPDEGMLEMARLLGMTMAQLAAANRRLIGETYMQPGDTEYEVATRLAMAARIFSPMMADSLAYLLNVHLREQIRHDAIGVAEVSAGSLGSAQEVTVCFADLSDFTRLGETLPPEELGAVTGRLGELASSVVSSPVRLVKLIGDAAMLVGPEPDGVLDSALDLIDAAEAEHESFPLLRAGVAAGPALPRAGDYYGRPVNLASRITDVARPASVLVDERAREAASEGRYRWSFARSRRLKGIDGEVKLFRCRRAHDGDGDGG